jgi:hypothetical protein
MIDDDLDYFFGLYLAEGNPSSKGIALTFGHTESELAAKATKIGEQKFNVSPSRHEDESVIRLTFCSTTLRDFFLDMFYYGSHHANGKRVPWGLMPMSEAMLKGLEDGDGGAYGRNREMATVSPSLMFQAFFSLQSLGESVNLSKGKGGSLIQGRSVNAQPLWRVRYTSNPRKIYTIKTDAGRLRSVTKVSTKPYRGWVYNLEVEGDYSYTVNGIAVHNCIPKYPASWADFGCNLEYLHVFNGYSNHVPLIAAPMLVCAHALKSPEREFYLELHYKLKGTTPVDDAVSFHFEQVQGLVEVLREWENASRSAWLAARDRSQENYLRF